MRLSDRQARIVAILSKADGPVTGGELSASLGCSVRTIQADVARINALCKSPEIEGTNRGYSLRADSQLAERARPSEPSAPLERMVLARLLIEGKPIGFAELSLRLYSSESAIERCLNWVRTTLATHGLRLVRQGARLSVEGGEDERRRLLGSLVCQEGRDAYSGRQGQIAMEVDLEYVRSILAREIHSRDGYVEPGYERSLSANVAIALYRMRTVDGSLRTLNPSVTISPEEHQIARAVCSSYARKWRVNVREEDLRLIESLLSGQVKWTGRGGGVSSGTPSESTLDTVRGILSDALGQYGLAVRDEALIRGFALHVEDLIRRSEYGQVEETWVADELRHDYPFVYEAALIVANGIANHYSIRLSDGEIGLICMHVGMLVGEVDARPVEIAILSSPYLAIARRIGDLLCERLGSRVVVKAFGGLGNAPSVSSDIVIFTGESDAIPPGMAVKVSPLFGESDFRRVERAIQRVERRREIAKNDEMDSFLDSRFFFLADDFEPPISSREEAISLLCSRMREAGLVGELFEESVRERERAAPTAFGGSFAIPHATRMDARETVVGVLVSRGGIAWGGSCVNVVLLLAVSATDRQRFVSIFDALAQVLWGEGEVSRLSRCESFGEFRDELRAGMSLR